MVFPTFGDHKIFKYFIKVAEKRKFRFLNIANWVRLATVFHGCMHLLNEFRNNRENYTFLRANIMM